nr:putative ribonuclease H-like domain-containing protein [Tanacetum cinerariifolium]
MCFSYFSVCFRPFKTLCFFNYALMIRQDYDITSSLRRGALQEVFDPVARIEAIRLFLAYASLLGFMVYQIYVKSAFLYGTIEEKVYICQPLGFKDPNYPNKVYKVVKALYGLHQAPRAWYETLANYLLENGFQRGKIDQTLFIKRQVSNEFNGGTHILFGSISKQKKDGIFISHDKYVAEILRKFGLTDGKSASTPIYTKKPLLKDPDGEDVDVNTYRSMIGSLMYLTSSRPDIMGMSIPWMQIDLLAMQEANSCSTSSTKAEYVAAESCCAQVALSSIKSLKRMLHVTNILSDGSLTTPQMVLNSPCLTHIKNWLVQIRRSLSWLVQKQAALGVNTPRCDEDRLELMELMVFLLPSDEKVRIEVSAVDLQVSAVRLIYYQGIKCLPNEEIFAELARMGYEKSSTKLTFYKAFFSSQWKVGKGCSGVETPLIEGMIVEQPVGEGADEVHDEGVHAVGAAAEGATSVADEEVPAADNIAQDLEVTKLKKRVKKLERRNKASKIKRLQKVGITQRIKTSDDTIMDDVSKQWRMIANMDADVDVTLKDVVLDARIDENDKGEPTKIQEVVEVVTTTKLITKVVTAASATITAAAPQLTTDAAPTLTTAPSAARRRKGVVIRDSEEFATPSTIIHTEAKSKDKGKGILDEVIDHVQRNQKEDNAVKRYLALKRKPQTEAQARKNMMIYLRNVAGFKMDYFKGMTYDDIRSIFKKYFNSNVDFLQKTKEKMDEEDSRALKRLSESQEDKASKKQKLDEEVEELKKHLIIVSNDDDNGVYIEATLLALKVPVVYYEIYTESNKPYYKIKRADGLHQLYLSFVSMLRNFNREDLEVL